jgi:mevalonate kinase
MSAKRLIGGIRDHMLAGESATSKNLRELGNIADRAIGILEKGDVRRTADLGVLALRAQDTLKDLGLSTPILDMLLEKGKSAGALGGKLSGAGGGGAFFLLYPDAESAGEGADYLNSEAAAAGLSTADTIRSVNWYNPMDKVA